MKKLFVIIMFLIIIASAGAVFAYNWYQGYTHSPNSSSTDIVDFEIKQNEDVKIISKRLFDNGLINNPEIFVFYVKQTNKSDMFKAGNFRIAKNLNYDEILEVLNKPLSDDVKVSFPEGLRMDEISDTLNSQFFKISGSKFSKTEFDQIIKNPRNYNLDADIVSKIPEGNSLEGFLFPDTYYFAPNVTTKEVVVKLLANFKLKFFQKYMTSTQKYSLYETVTLASIIEREGRNEDDRYLISDVLIKRLDGKLEGVKLLQVDASILYEKKNWKHVITKSDKDKDTAYNTYKRIGLTPTPISNPSFESLDAAINPKANNYFYYIHDDNGIARFAQTLSQHDRNVRCYINKNYSYCDKG